MLKDNNQFKEFIYNYLFVLEELTASDKFNALDSKFLAQLRTAERSFNFILDQYPAAQISAMFGPDAWISIKQRRDFIANKVATAIDSEPEIKSRYTAYCESLKDTRRLGSYL